MFTSQVLAPRPAENKANEIAEAAPASMYELSGLISTEDERGGRVQQMLVDPEEHNDWVAEFEVNLARCREAAEAVLRLVRLGSPTQATSPLAPRSRAPWPDGSAPVTPRRCPGEAPM